MIIDNAISLLRDFEETITRVRQLERNPVLSPRIAGMISGATAAITNAASAFRTGTLVVDQIGPPTVTHDSVAIDRPPLPPGDNLEAAQLMSALAASVHTS